VKFVLTHGRKHAKEKHDVSFCETCFCLLTSKDMRKAHYKEHKCAPYCVSTKCKKAASNATGSNQRHEKRDSCPRKACGDDELSYLVALYEQHRAIDTTDAPGKFASLDMNFHVHVADK
jgi:hypothetical protein